MLILVETRYLTVYLARRWLALGINSIAKRRDRHFRWGQRSMVGTNRPGKKIEGQVKLSPFDQAKLGAHLTPPPLWFVHASAPDDGKRCRTIFGGNAYEIYSGFFDPCNKMLSNLWATISFSISTLWSYKKDFASASIRNHNGSIWYGKERNL